MTRQEALSIARQLAPEGFNFNALVLTDSGQWVASFVDDSEPPQAVIERWPDVYTDADPDPEEAAEEPAEVSEESVSNE